MEVPSTPQAPEQPMPDPGEPAVPDPEPSPAPDPGTPRVPEPAPPEQPPPDSPNLPELNELAQELDLEEDETSEIQETLEARGIRVSDDCGRNGVEATHFSNT